jgi:hypothetical protein
MVTIAKTSSKSDAEAGSISVEQALWDAASLNILILRMIGKALALPVTCSKLLH